MKNTPITLELVLEEVNGVLMALGQLPYAQVAGLVEKIRDQATSQVPVPSPSSVEVAEPMMEEPEAVQ
jgi:hypothetical protein